jgi:ankyrin repeat protein
MTRLNAHNWIGCTCRLCGKKRYGDKLIEAAKNGNDDVVSELINNGVDVNTIDFTGSTALIYAADRGKLSIVKKLVTAGANLNIKNNKGQSSCWVAAGSGHADILTELITHGGDPNAKDNSGRTVLIIASLSAAKYGCIAILETLLNVKIDINARCTEGISALSYVLMSALSSPNSFNGLTDVVKLLLSNGAYKSNDDFMLIMKIAAQTNNTELFNFSQTDFKNKKTSKPIVSNSMNNKGRATPGLEELKNIWARTYMDGQLFTKEVQTVGYRWTEEVPLPWGSADVMVRGEDKFIISIKTVVSVA